MQQIFQKISEHIITPAVSVLFILAFVIFSWGVVTMIMNAGDPDARKTGQRNVLWGVVGMVIMLSVYGIIRVIANTVGVNDPFTL